PVVDGHPGAGCGAADGTGDAANETEEVPGEQVLAPHRARAGTGGGGRRGRRGRRRPVAGGHEVHPPVGGARIDRGHRRSTSRATSVGGTSSRASTRATLKLPGRRSPARSAATVSRAVAASTATKGVAGARRPDVSQRRRQ